MSKRTGNRTGREAKRRRRRHERATARRRRNYVWEAVLDATPRHHVGVDLAADSGRVVCFSRHAGKEWLLAETAALIRSGRIVFPPPTESE